LLFGFLFFGVGGSKEHFIASTVSCFFFLAYPYFFFVGFLLFS